MSELNKPLLIFDLDETLVHANKEMLSTKADFEFEQYYVYKRPHLQETLTHLSDFFHLAIWSSAGDEYVEHIVNQIKPESISFEFAWGYSRCTQKFDPDTASYLNLKNLKKVKRKGYSLRRTLIVDNTPSKVSANYGNAIYIQDFTGTTSDDELLKLQDYLLLIKDKEDFSRIEKRFWRSHIR